ncbi:MAG: glycosyltransferase [Oscillospiraceae bacterium]|nr:glycosyltransferase [Oscillospiraceae bacterium]
MDQLNRPRVLVLVTDHPGGGRKESHRFVHVRDLYYQEHGIDVTVLNFSGQKDYIYEGIRVICMETYRREPDGYDVLIAHQPNIRDHYRFLKRYGHRFPRSLLFFHGHEIRRFREAYPKPYPYMGASWVKTTARDLYDRSKIAIWRRYIPKLLGKTELVFVSQSMLEEFLHFTRLSREALEGRYHIIHNCVGRLFEEGRYDPKGEKDYDMVTIRSDLDSATYCIDVVDRLAKAAPELRFLVVGKGKYFQHNGKAPNITWEDRTLDHGQIISVLQRSRCALMPTRVDSQGLMTCEMATFGMPVITSDIPVCHEVLGSFENVALIGNDATDVDLPQVLEVLEKKLPGKKNDRYFSRNTTAREVDLIFAAVGAARQDRIEAGGSR